MKRKITVLTATRATYGYNRRIMILMKKSKDLELSVVVTGMHLLKKYGLTVREVENDKLPIVARVPMMIAGDTPTAWARSLGLEIESLAQVFDKIRPDILLVSGDRGEMLAATMAAVYMNIPVAHLQSGDLSGHIDGSARHAITKLSHIHFPACKDSAKRVEKMGEEPWRIFNVGAPQLDEVIYSVKPSEAELSQELGVRLKRPFIIILQHPILNEIDQTGRQMVETLEAAKKLKLQAFVIYPNVDAASLKIINTIRRYEHLPFVKTFRNMDRRIFLGLLEKAAAIVGNSSCGIIEAPSFKLAAINIGNRQRGRMQAINVVNVPHDRHRIAKALQTVLGNSFQKKLRRCVNPYGDGRSSERVVKILSEIPLNQRLLDKQMSY